MDNTNTKIYSGTPFSIQLEKVENNPGSWSSTKVSIYRKIDQDNILIGEYKRNYPSYAFNTFNPFEIDGQWYALYSKDYTATRVMKLNETDVEDWCGEERSANGFCPVEYLIPIYRKFHSNYVYNGIEQQYDYYSSNIEYKSDEDFFNVEDGEKLVETKYCNFAFMCGCVWGDDTSWKLKYIDLSKIPDKILEITEKFGYWELPAKLSLRDCIDMEDWEPNHRWIKLIKMARIDLDSDKVQE